MKAVADTRTSSASRTHVTSASHVPPSTMTRTKLFRQRTLSEQQALAKKIEAGWTNAIDRLRPKSNPNSQRRLRQGYTAEPRYGTKTEMLDKRAENKRPKSGYRLNGTDGVRCPSRPPLALAPPKGCCPTTAPVGLSFT